MLIIYVNPGKRQVNKCAILSLKTQHQPCAYSSSPTYEGHDFLQYLTKAFLHELRVKNMGVPTFS
jgi:hypothetical protein